LGVEHKHVRKNPFVDIKVDVPRQSRSRETKAFTEDEASTILKAALAIKTPKTPLNRAKRWVPWLCAYSGARAGEVTQLRGEDIEKRGSGSAYAYSARDAEGDYLDGGKTYKITLPAPIPVAQFWSFMVYDGQTRSMLETDQKLAGLDGTSPTSKRTPMAP
jgi:hypothetical protein